MDEACCRRKVLVHLAEHRRLFLHQKDGTRHSPHQLFIAAPEQEMLQPALFVCKYDKEVDARFSDDFQDNRCGLSLSGYFFCRA
jgi:hypothetical protein